MKLKAKELTDSKNFVSHIILSCFNNAAHDMISGIKGRNEETEYDIELKINGVDLDINKFAERLEGIYDEEVRRAASPEAERLLEIFKQKYRSKNSQAVKLSKIKDRIDKANNQLKNIQESIENIRFY